MPDHIDQLVFVQISPRELISVLICFVDESSIPVALFFLTTVDRGTGDFW